MRLHALQWHEMTLWQALTERQPYVTTHRPSGSTCAARRATAVWQSSGPPQAQACTGAGPGQGWGCHHPGLNHPALPAASGAAAPLPAPAGRRLPLLHRVPGAAAAQPLHRACWAGIPSVCCTEVADSAVLQGSVLPEPAQGPLRSGQALGVSPACWVPPHAAAPQGACRTRKGLYAAVAHAGCDAPGWA